MGHGPQQGRGSAIDAFFSAALGGPHHGHGPDAPAITVDAGMRQDPRGRTSYDVGVHVNATEALHWLGQQIAPHPGQQPPVMLVQAPAQPGALLPPQQTGAPVQQGFDRARAFGQEYELTQRGGSTVTFTPRLINVYQEGQALQQFAQQRNIEAQVRDLDRKGFNGDRVREDMLRGLDLRPDVFRNRARDEIPCASVVEAREPGFTIKGEQARILQEAARTMGGCEILGTRVVEFVGRREFGLYLRQGDQVYLQLFQLPRDTPPDQCAGVMKDCMLTVLAEAIKHLPQNRLQPVPQRPAAGVPAYNLQQLGQGIGVGERPLLAAAVKPDEVRGQLQNDLMIRDELQRSRPPVGMQDGRDLDVKPVLDTFNADPRVLPFVEPWGATASFCNIGGRAAQDIQREANQAGLTVLGTRGICWDRGAFALYLYDSQTGGFYMQPFTIARSAQMSEQQLGSAMRQAVPDVMRFAARALRQPPGAPPRAEPGPREF